MFYECVAKDVQKGLRFYLLLSFTLYCHGLPGEKKDIKAIQISYIEACLRAFLHFLHIYFFLDICLHYVRPEVWKGRLEFYK